MVYTEEQLEAWTAPLSKTENSKATNTIGMIKSAIEDDPNLQGIDIEVFLQGSYGNNTNIRGNSDVDVCVMCKSTFFDAYPNGMDRSDYGFSEGSLSFWDFKQYILGSLQNKFGCDTVSIGNKSIKIQSNTYHVDADVVPAFMYRNYKLIESEDPEIFLEGIKFFAKDGSEVINYPKIHLRNGVEKNIATNHRYKKLVRIVKNIRTDMVDAGLIDGDKITSFLVECLVWNFSNSHINSFTSYTDLLEKFVAVEWNQMDREEHKEWGEVSECLYLFNYARKWTDAYAKDFLLKLWGIIRP